MTTKVKIENLGPNGIEVFYLTSIGTEQSIVNLGKGSSTTIPYVYKEQNILIKELSD